MSTSSDNLAAELVLQGLQTQYAGSIAALIRRLSAKEYEAAIAICGHLVGQLATDAANQWRNERELLTKLRELALANDPAVTAVKRIRVSVAGLDTYTQNALSRKGVEFLDELTEWRRSDLLKLRSMGTNRVARIIGTLRNIGLRLKEEEQGE
jgi:DNA-directed RNA polymerase alpha subunit